jgi:SAM-dependent methyltransferase
MKRYVCRGCGSSLLIPVLDLGTQPPSNQLKGHAEPWAMYPLSAVVCTGCWLMQTGFDVPHAELFTADYPFRSGVSREWKAHCEKYVQDITKRLSLNEHSTVVEIGGNDGTLLKNFNCWHLNVEPSAEAAEEARANGVTTITTRFQELALPQDQLADLIIANNVLAHDPDLQGFAAALKRNLAPNGTITIEFPWLLKLLENCEFDTIYHEHYSYFSIRSLSSLLERHSLFVYDAEYLPIHGGSIRAYVKHDVTHWSRALAELRLEESPLRDLCIYRKFHKRAFEIADEIWHFARQPIRLYGAGAAAKATVFTNFAQLTYNLIPFVGDATPTKQGKRIPGANIPIVSEERLLEQNPTHILIFAWNYKNEIAAKYRALGYKGKFVVAIPKLEVFD